MYRFFINNLERTTCSRVKLIYKTFRNKLSHPYVFNSVIQYGNYRFIKNVAMTDNKKIIIDAKIRIYFGRQYSARFYIFPKAYYLAKSYDVH